MGIGADFTLVGRELIHIVLGPGWEEAGRIFVFFGPGIGVMLLYDTHGWIHLSIGRPERWLHWSLIEFTCTASLFLLTLRWGPSGVAFAWTLSYFLLMFPAFWFAGKPIGLDVKKVAKSIWRFFVASAGAGCVTVVLLKAAHIYGFESKDGASAAFVRLISISLVFFALYLGAVIALYRGLEPINETLDVLRDLLPHRASGHQQVPVQDGPESKMSLLPEEEDDNSHRDFAMASNDLRFKDH
jgi:PST family polysaccharide transporter